MGRHGWQEDSCYKTFEKEDDLKEHIQDSHNGGKYGINTDFKCDECGEEFNKFTTLKMGKLPLKEYFERHTCQLQMRLRWHAWFETRSVLNQYYWWNKTTSCSHVMWLVIGSKHQYYVFVGEEFGLTGQRTSKIFCSKEKHIQVHSGTGYCYILYLLFLY